MFRLSRCLRLGATFLLLFSPVALLAGELKIIHIRVGQGDATLILGPETTAANRVRILIDAGNIATGGYDGGKIVGAVLHKNKVTELDYFIATHYDADHIGGAVAGEDHMHGRSFVLGPNNVPGAEGDDDEDDRTDWLDSSLTMIQPDPEELGKGDDVKIKFFVDRGDVAASNTQTYKKYKAMATSMGTRRSLTTQDDVNSFEIDLGDGAKMTCIAANGFVRDRDEAVPNVNTENEKSLCFLLKYGKFDYLTGGDAIGRPFGSENAEVEQAMGEYIEDEGIQVDILHVNHHGANNASAAEFLAAVKPEMAVISLGNDNAHHHPHHETLDRLVEAGVYRIFQTSWGTTQGVIPPEVRRHQAIYQGDIIVTTDGSRYDVSTSRTFPTDE